MPAFNLPTLLRAIAVWLLLIPAETVRGGLRRLLTSPEVEVVVRQASVFAGALILFAITWFSLGARSPT